VTHCHVRRWVVAASLLLLGLGANAIADNWPQWRGPEGDCVSKEKNLPTEWSDTKNIVWRLKLPGMGSGTPALWGDRIFLNADDGKDLFAMCVNTKGEEVWKKTVGTSTGKKYHGDSNDASPSTNTDGKHVYFYFGTGDLACFDLGGKEVWKLSVQDRYGKMTFQWGGIHSTPLLHGDRLYLQLLNRNGAKVVALDKNTGEEVWKIDRQSDGRGEGKEVYASPVLGHNGKEDYLIIHGTDYATGHTLKDGAEIWRVGDLNSKTNYNTTFRFVTSPTATADLVVVPSCKNGPVAAIKPDAKGAVAPGSPSELWRYNRTPDVCCPLVVDGLVYLCGDGTLTCLDAKTGKEQYANERTHSHIHRASPVYADGKIYLTAQDGVTTVVKAGPKFELLATNKLPDKVNATPVIADGRIYLRGFDALYAIGK
jgi:outer membrane protein assembly factor BamB